MPTAGKQSPAFERADFHARDEDCDLDEIYLALADSTPKSGGIFFDDTDELAKSIAKKERADVTVIPFSVPKHEMKDGTATLISSTNEKVTTHLTSTEDLKNCNAAKEFVKKIGITSGQFYKAISTFK